MFVGAQLHRRPRKDTSDAAILKARTDGSELLLPNKPVAKHQIGSGIVLVEDDEDVSGLVVLSCSVCVCVCVCVCNSV